MIVNYNNSKNSTKNIKYSYSIFFTMYFNFPEHLGFLNLRTTPSPFSPSFLSFEIRNYKFKVKSFRKDLRRSDENFEKVKLASNHPLHFPYCFFL